MLVFQPLSEVFGYPVDNNNREANRCRKLRLCPYNNCVPNCSKDKVENPLGVCSIYDKDKAAIVCPVRFRQDWLIIEDASNLFFPSQTLWTTFTDIKLLDREGKSVGVLDFVLVSYDLKGNVKDFGVLSVQASYVTQSLRKPFEQFMDNPERYKVTEQKGRIPYVDYTASIQRRLCPRLLFNGGILHAWQKKMAVAIDSQLYQNLPPFEEVPESLAELTWFVYEMVFDGQTNKFTLKNVKTVHTLFEPTLFQITKVDVGPIEDFLDDLQERLDVKLDNKHVPENSISLTSILQD